VKKQFFIAVFIIYSISFSQSVDVTNFDRTYSGDLKAQIEAAPWGSVVNITAGTYNVSSDIIINNNNIVINGAGSSQTIIIFTGGSSGFWVNGSGVTIKNLMIRTLTTTSDGAGIACCNYGTQIENVCIHNFLTGLTIRSNSWCTQVRNCDLSWNSFGIFLVNTASEGPNNHLVTISDCNLSYNKYYGIDVASYAYGANIAIRNNAIQDNGYSGIRVEVAFGIVIENNYFEDNEWQLQSAGNEAYSQDAHILFTEQGTTPLQQISHVTIKNNYFHCSYPTTVPSNTGFTIDTTKGHDTATYKTVRPWRFINTSFFSTATNTGTDFQFDTSTGDGNYYLPYNAGGWGSSEVTKYRCTNKNTGY
jgi:hypothetical protein